jgi:hypothetical protein
VSAGSVNEVLPCSTSLWPRPAFGPGRIGGSWHTPLPCAPGSVLHHFCLIQRILAEVWGQLTDLTDYRGPASIIDF